MDIFEELHQEHESVAELLSQLEESGRDDKTFRTLKEGLTAHAKAEEKVFYRRLEDESATRDTVLEGYEEHKLVIKVLADLERTTDDDDKWMAQLTVLKENVEHHVEEEEGTLFPSAREVIGEDEAVELREKFEEAKKDIAA